MVIEPLLIDEDYYARVEGREIISNLSKAAGLATMIATMRPGALSLPPSLSHTVSLPPSLPPSLHPNPSLPCFTLSLSFFLGR